MTAKRKLSDFDFSNGNAAIALVSKDVGGPANGVKTLVMKSSDVKVELSMAEFLNRFFGIWSGDAQFIARMLGYSDDVESLWNDEKLGEQVSLMKSMKNGETDIDVDQIKNVLKAIADKNNLELTDYVVNEEVDDEIETNEEEEIEMTQEQIEQINKSLADQTEVIKGLTAQLNEYKTREENAEKEKFAVIAKGYQKLGLDETEVESMTTALIKMTKDEDLKVVAELLGTAVTKMEALASEITDNQIGTDIDIDENGDSAIMKALIGQKNK